VLECAYHDCTRGHVRASCRTPNYESTNRCANGRRHCNDGSHSHDRANGHVGTHSHTASGVGQCLPRRHMGVG
jgi:hypothetical protein